MDCWEFINNYAVGICIFLIIVAMAFIMIGHIWRDEVQLVLKHEFFKFPESSLDRWSVSHAMLFGIFGFLIPNRPLSFFTLGVVFELFEDFLSADESTQLVDCKNNKQEAFGGIWCNGIQTDYWYMNPTDPWVNLTGYIIGSAIRTTIFKGK